MPIPTKSLRTMLTEAIRRSELHSAGGTLIPEEMTAGIMRVIREYDPCFAKAAEAGEPTFTLRAQDATADTAVNYWIALNEGLPIERRNEAWACMEAMRAWPNRRLPD